jgi:hypothetical protein
MSHGGNDSLDDGKLDLVPMIDTVMLLLLFFILTTKFTSEERVLAAVLPTDKGGGTAAAPLPPERVRVVVEPADGGATVRVGGGEPFLVETAALQLPPGADLDAALARLHHGISARLSVYEAAGARRTQVPIDVHCYTRLPWRFALTTYDAVRAFERSHGESADDLREVAFAAPPLRGRDAAPERELAFLRSLR